MAETVEKTRARRALNELGRFFGLNRRSMAEGLTGGTAPVKEDAKPSFLADNSILNAFFSKGRSIPYVRALFQDGTNDGSNPDALGLEARFVVTPYSIDYLPSPGVLGGIFDNTSFPTPYQGFGQPAGNCHAIQDHCVPEVVRNNEAARPIHVIQSFDPRVSVTQTDVDLASFLLNAVPTLEWSRSVPYFEVAILSPESSNKDTDELAKRTLVFNFLKGGTLQPGEKEYAAALYNFEKDQPGPDGKPQSSKADSVAATMDAFCLPQTMVNATNYTTKIENGINVFAPLMSVDSFSVQAAGYINEGKNTRIGQSPAANHTATLRIRLHDKRRLKDISALVKPSSDGGFGNTKLAITFGWSHPDGLSLERPSDANAGARYGDLIDATRKSEVYRIVESRLSFVDGGEVQVDLELQFAESRDVFVASKMVGGASTTETELSESVESVIDFVAMNKSVGLSAKRKPNFHVKAFLKKLDSELSYDPSLKQKLKEYKDAVTAAGFTKAANTSNVAALSTLFNEVFVEQDASYFSEAASKSNPNSSSNALVAELLKGGDPFLRPTFPNLPKAACFTHDKFKQKSTSPADKLTNNAYVSLGKLVTFFVSQTLSTADVFETQIIFYPYNSHAAGLFAHNIAQTPIPTADLKKKIAAYVKENGNVQMNDFLTFIFDTYVHDPTMSNCPAYGLQGVKSKDRDKTLNKIYGRPENSKVSPKMIMPRLRIASSTHLMRTKLAESDAASEHTGDAAPDESVEGDETFSPRRIFRIEIYDEGCSSGPFLADLSNNQDTGAIPKLIRDVSADMALCDDIAGIYAAADHQSLYDKQLEYFSTPPRQLVKSIDTSGSEAKDMLKKLNEGLDGQTRKVDGVEQPVAKIPDADFEQLMNEYTFIVTADESGDVRAILRDEARTVSNGYILHGIEGTAVIDLTCQTSQDTDAKNIMMQDTRSDDEKKAQKKQGIERIPITTIPTEIDVQCLGNPFVLNGQEFYVDLGTDTNLDGYYIVSEVVHDIEPGKFETKFKLTPSLGGPTYSNSFSRIMSFIAGQLVETE